MDTQVVDQPSVRAPIEASRDHAASAVARLQSARPDAGRVRAAPPAQRETPHIARWQTGAHLAIGMVSLLVLLLLAMVAVFSVPSAQLFTIDAAVGLAIIALGLALSGLLALSRS